MGTWVLLGIVHTEACNALEVPVPSSFQFGRNIHTFQEDVVATCDLLANAL